jgi:hypothetical protein
MNTIDQFPFRGRPMAAARAGVFPSIETALVNTESSRRLSMRAPRIGVLLLVTGVALIAALTDTSTSADDPAPVSAKVEQPKARSSPIHVRVVDAEGRPMEGIEIVVFQLTERAFKVKTDREGLVVLTKPRSEEWFSLLARRDGGATGFTHYPPMRLERNTAEKPIVLTLTSDSRKVTGSVVDPRGRPIPGVRVIGHSLQFDEGNFSLPRRQLEKEGYPLGWSLTDATGRYTLAVPAHADLTLGFLHPERVSPWIMVPEAVETIEPITLQPAGRITGKAIDAATGAPVVGAQVGAYVLEHPSDTNGAGGEVTCDAEGKFTINGLEAGVYNVCLDRVPGRIKATARGVVGVRVRSAEDTEVELKVFDGIPLQGLVIDPSTNQGLPDVWVWCKGPAQPSPGSTIDVQRSDEHGRFTFFVPPGENYVYLPLSEGRASRLGRTSVSVPNSGNVPPIRLVGPSPDRPQAAMKGMISAKTTVTMMKRIRPSSVRMPPKRAEGRTVIGQALGSDGRPLVGVTIDARIVTPDSTRTLATMVSDREGIFIAKGLPAGEVTMVATRFVGVADRDSLTQVVPGDRDNVDFTFGPAIAAEGGRAGQPAPASDEVIPAALKDRLTFVNLDSKGNDFLADGPGGNGDDLNRMVQGIHALDGAYHRIGEKLVHVRARSAPSLPAAVTAIAVAATADQIRFLHSARGEVPHGTEVGFYTVHYADGTSERVPVVFGRDAGDWFSANRHPLVTTTHARVSWTGTNDMADRTPPNQIKIHLYGSTWKNPHPERMIATIDATSSTAESELVLVGVTLER